MLRLPSIALLVALCALEALALTRSGGPGVVVTPATTALPLRPANPSPIEADFLAHMTADDVARGVYGLGTTAGAPALSAEQRALLAPLLEEGAGLRARLGELRMARRRAREAWMADSAAMVGVVGADRVEWR